jgi:hypothetical protein
MRSVEGHLLFPWGVVWVGVRLSTVGNPPDEAFNKMTRGTLMTLFSARPIMYDGVSGVASKIALTAFATLAITNHENTMRPMPTCQKLTIMRSRAHGRPPRCVWPNVVTRVSSLSLSERTFLMSSARNGFKSLSWAPSATITIVLRFPSSRC